jgi:type I restriction enzyme S subunit
MAGEGMETPYGQFAADFAVDRLVDLCDSEAGIQTGPFGSQLHQEDYVPEGTPIITVEHLGENRILHDGVPRVSDRDRDRLSRYLLRKGDIVFSRVGSVDRRALVRSAEDGWMFSGRCLRVRPDAQKVDSGYLSYFFGLPTFKEHIRAIAVGATMPSLNTNLLSDVLVPYPQDVAEQRAIAHILGTLDDKIELNRRMSETLEAMARALFKSWFVDFDPVRAKMEGRDPGLPKSLSNLFPDRLVDSGLGEIPEGWGIGHVDDEFNLTMGQSPPGETYNVACDGVPFYQGRADFESRFPRRRVYCTAPTRLAQKGDTLVSVRAPVGDINMAFEDCAIGRGVAAARHRSGSRSYTYQFMLGLEEVFTRFEAEGTVFGAISKKDFHAIPCVVVPPEIVAAFERALAPLDDRVEIIMRQCGSLASLRDALLPKLISGELRLSLPPARAEHVTA